VKLHKLSGAGNDFLAWADAGDGAAEPASVEPAVDQIVAWCRRGLSVGADGFLVLRREEDRSAPDLVRLIHRDADGSRPELCLNGTRCGVELAAHLGWGDDEGRLTMRTDSGDVDGARVTPGRSRVSVPPSFLDPPRQVTLDVDGRSYEGRLLRVGGPHFVLEWPGELDTAPVLTLGAALRRHPGVGAAGSNVHFVQWTDGAVHLRSFERGVEGETLACGTGSIAASLVGELLGHLPEGLDPQVDCHTRGGFRLSVGRDGEGRLTLEGDSRRVAVVEVLEGARA